VTAVSCGWQAVSAPDQYRKIAPGEFVTSATTTKAFEMLGSLRLEGFVTFGCLVSPGQLKLNTVTAIKKRQATCAYTKQRNCTFACHRVC
jgi:hypothetical protein